MDLTSCTDHNDQALETARTTNQKDKRIELEDELELDDMGNKEMVKAEDSFDFMLEAEGPRGTFAVFTQDEGAGYFFAYKPSNREVLEQVEVYVCSDSLQVQESDIRLLWSHDQKKCGVAIWGRMHGIIDVDSKSGIVARLENRSSTAINDAKWLNGFDTYLDQDNFIRVRQRFWKEMAKKYSAAARPKPENETPIETNFIVYDKGPDDFFAVFEDDGDSGCLYLYGREHQRILEHVHVYDRSEKLNVTLQDVQILWTKDGAKCGVIIWDKMRAIIDRQKSRPGRVWMEDRNTPGIADQEWLNGF